MTSSKHDASYKLLFSYPEVVRDLVLGFIPDEWLHSLDFGTLEKVAASFVTDDYPASQTIKWRERLSALTGFFTLSTLGVTLWTGIASLGLYTFMAEILSSRSMTDWTNIFIWLWGIGGMVGALFIGHIIDHHLPASKATLVLLVIMGIGFALMGYAPTPWAAAGCFIWGMCGWASMAPQQHALVSHAPRQAAASIAWNSSANYLGSGIGAALGSAALNAGKPVPPPAYQPEPVPDVSGRFVTRLPKSVHAKLAERAKAEGVSLNTLVLSYIAQGLGQGNKPNHHEPV